VQLKRRTMKEIDPLTFLKAVYMNAELPLSVRMWAAIEGYRSLIQSSQ